MTKATSAAPQNDSAYEPFRNLLGKSWREKAAER